MMSMEFSQQVLQILWHATWQSAFLAGIVFIVIQLVGRWITPSWRVALWAIPLIRLVVLLLPATPLSMFQWISDPITHIPQPAAVTQGTNHAMPLMTTRLEPRSFPASEPSITTTVDRDLLRQPTSWPWALFAHLAIVIWVSGVVMLSMRWLASRIALHQVLRRGEMLCNNRLPELIAKELRQMRGMRHVSCILTDENIGPSTCGFVRPTIILCKQMVNDLAADDLRMIVAHEMEHVRRFDCLLLVLGRLATTLHWFNPAAYILRRRIHHEIELAVDALTVGKLGESNATSYGELLIRLASRPRGQLGLIQMAGRGSNLRRRVQQLTNWKRQSRWQLALSAAIVCSLAFTGLSDTRRQSVVAQDSADAIETVAGQGDFATLESTEETQQPTEIENEIPAATAAELETKYHASGRVVDAVGQPVPSTRLFCNVHTVNGTLQSVSATCNERGEFSIAYPPSGREFEMFQTWAYSKDHSIRVVMMGRLFFESGVRVAEDVEIQLPAKESISLRVLLPSGEPCVDAIVRPRHFDVPNGTFAADEATGLSIHFPNELAALIGRHTNPDGRVSIGSVPKTLLKSIFVETPKLGQQSFRQFDGDVRLAPVGSITGVLMHDEPSQFAGTKVYVVSETLERQRADGTLKPQGYAEVVIDERGRFHVPAIAEGAGVRLFMAWDSDLSIRPVLEGKHSVRAAETLELMVETRATTLVRGRIITSDTRQPVVGATLRMRHRYSLDSGSQAKTDQQGRYSIRAPAGPVRRHFTSLGSNSIEAEFDRPRQEIIEIQESSQSFEAEDIEITGKRLVKGVLRDKAGRPISAATVVLHSGSFRHLRGKAETNFKGEFQMRVRGWAKVSEVIRAKQWYWATLDRPAINTQPPKLTRLTVIKNDPDAMVLRKP